MVETSIPTLLLLLFFIVLFPFKQISLRVFTVSTGQLTYPDTIIHEKIVQLLLFYALFSIETYAHEGDSGIRYGTIRNGIGIGTVLAAIIY